MYNLKQIILKLINNNNNSNTYKLEWVPEKHAWEIFTTLLIPQQSCNISFFMLGFLHISSKNYYIITFYLII